MREVLFKKWIQPVWPDAANSVNCNTTHRPLAGSNCWEDDFKHSGLFHQWANSFTEFESGAGNYTVALVELEDGTISEVLPSNLKFIDKLCYTA
jgi:hypothetical protein